MKLNSLLWTIIALMMSNKPMLCVQWQKFARVLERPGEIHEFLSLKGVESRICYLLCKW